VLDAGRDESGLSGDAVWRAMGSRLSGGLSAGVVVTAAIGLVVGCRPLSVTSVPWWWSWSGAPAAVLITQ
jgi:hypothetical protein